ncbi:MAG TPA: hypothetical protein VEK57_12245 [Thermoanaerobaculia bacterium]|nr:hypothetical protein [Thermoanaerobaculia bacterium]
MPNQEPWKPSRLLGQILQPLHVSLTAIFRRYASPSFAADIDRCEDDVARLGGTTYGDLVSALT